MPPKSKNYSSESTVKDNWEELKILIESIDRDLKKSITKGTKRSGVNARKGLMYAKELISVIYHGSIEEQKNARKKLPPHGNKNGAGVKAMLELRNIKKD